MSLAPSVCSSPGQHAACHVVDPGQNSLAAGRVHQQGDEGGGGRADAVEGQHGVLALLLAYHMLCGQEGQGHCAALTGPHSRRPLASLEGSLQPQLPEPVSAPGSSPGLGGGRELATPCPPGVQHRSAHLRGAHQPVFLPLPCPWFLPSLTPRLPGVASAWALPQPHPQPPWSTWAPPSRPNIPANLT